jgi:choline dehydrogenase-like flavoprotein
MLTSLLYIIGGTAGCVLANRLSENLDKKILVIEAGSSNYKHKSIQIPVSFCNTLFILFISMKFVVIIGWSSKFV